MDIATGGNGGGESLTKRVMMVFLMAISVARNMAPGLDAEFDELERRAHAGQTQSIIAGIVIGAALLIGLFVIAQINSALPTIENSDLSNARNTTVSNIGNGMVIGAVVIIVIFAAVILRVLRSL